MTNGTTGRIWCATIPEDFFAPTGPLAKNVQYIKGQLEVAPTTGYRHWQLIIYLNATSRLSGIRKQFDGHLTLSRSKAADEYVWKEDTAVAGTRFELGTKALKRNAKADWDAVKLSAVAGDLDDIPSDIYVRCYNQLKRIRSDHAQPVPIERDCYVYWGATGTGKSRRAWDQASMEAYAKDPRTKWWCGYRGQKNVVIDEFRGDINISHMLRWLDRYPVSVETKGGSTPLIGEKIWITSNLDPKLWYPDLDAETNLALQRRLKITHFNKDLG